MIFPFSKKKQSDVVNAGRLARFENAIEFANEISKIDAEGLVSYARLIATPLQSRANISAALSGPHGADSATTLDSLFFDLMLAVSEDGLRAYELAPARTDCSYRLRLGIDPVLATPWERDRLASALATIGFGKRQGAWEEDKSNHKVKLIFPLGIGLVMGGNHSLTAGISNCEGSVTSTETQDISPLYPHVHYNGYAFVRTHDGHELSRPVDEEPGILYEIGRLMVKHDVKTGIEYIEPGKQSEPQIVESSGYYHVLLNGKDAGVALTSSGAALALRQAGLQAGSEEWRKVISGDAALMRRNWIGEEESVQLSWRIRRQVVNDLKSVYGVMEWVHADAD